MQTVPSGQSQTPQEEKKTVPPPKVETPSMEEVLAENQRLKIEALQKENEALRSNQGSSGIVEGLTAALKIASPDHKHQAHGKTVGDMKELKLAQANGDELPMTTATDGKTQIREDEKHLMHVYLETVAYTEKGKKISPPGRIQKFDQNDFNRMTDNPHSNHFGQYDIIEILHDPRTKKNKSKANANISKKPPTEMSPEELHKTYAVLFGEEAPAYMNVSQLVLAIHNASYK